MVATRSQKRKRAPTESPQPEPAAQESHSPTPVPPVIEWEPTPPRGDSQQPSEPEGETDKENDGEHADSVARTRTRWLSWHDRALAFAVNEHKPFIQGHGRVTPAWEAVRKQLAENKIYESVDAIQRRFKYLVKVDKDQETRRMQETGTDEAIDDFTELMAELRSLWEDRKLKKDRVGGSRAAHEKAALETQGGKEIREAAMMSLVSRQALTDVTQHDDATHRERAGQRKRCRTSGPDSGGENRTPVGKSNKRTRARVTLMKMGDVLRNGVGETQDLLAEAREREDARHTQLLTSIQGLTSAIHQQTQQQAAERVRQEREHAMLLGMIAGRQ